MDLFVSGFLLSLSVCLDLGTVNVAMVRTGLQRGTGPAFWLGVGSCIGDLIYAGLSAVAISFILQFAPVRWALWLGGTAFLVLLAVRMLRDSMTREAAPEAAPDLQQPTEIGAARSNAYVAGQVLRGCGLALSSPSAILWFATVGGSVIATQLASHANLPHSWVIGLFFAGFFSAGLAWSLFIALVSGQGRRWMGPQWLRGVSLISALLFAYFAIKVFLDGYRAFILGLGA